MSCQDLTRVAAPFTLVDMSTDREVLASPLLTREQVAERLNVSPRTVDRYIALGVLVATRLPTTGGKQKRRPVRVSEASLHEFMHPFEREAPPRTA